MSSIVYTTGKNGTRYAYQSESYWDKDKKQPRCRRKLLGKVDEHGNIVPTGKRGRPRKNQADAESALAISASLDSAAKLREQEDELTYLKQQLTESRVEIQKLTEERDLLQKKLDSLDKLIKEMNGVMAR